MALFIFSFSVELKSFYYAAKDFIIQQKLKFFIEGKSK